MNTLTRITLVASVASFALGCAGANHQPVPQFVPQFDVTQRVQFYYSLFFDHTDAFTPDMPQADSFRVDPWDAPMLNGAEGYFLVAADDFRMGLSPNGKLCYLYNDKWMRAFSMYVNEEIDFPTTELLPKEQMNERAMDIIKKMYGEVSIVQMHKPIFGEDPSKSMVGLASRSLPSASYYLKINRSTQDTSSGVFLELDWLFGIPVQFAEWP